MASPDPVDIGVVAPVGIAALVAVVDDNDRLSCADDWVVPWTL